MQVKANNLTQSMHQHNCGCAACSATDLHWRVRRHQRLAPFKSINKVASQTACDCSKCRTKALKSAQNEHEAHDFWRTRRQIRHGWPITASALEQEDKVFQQSDFSNTPNPVRSFFGKTASKVLSLKPWNWRKISVFKGAGWILLDEKGNERIRFMFPNPRYKRGANTIWRHIATGYWRVRDGQGNYLDGDGRIVARNQPFKNLNAQQKFAVHIIYSGVDHELDELEWLFEQAL